MKEQLLILLTTLSPSFTTSHQFATCFSHVLCLLHAHRPSPLSLDYTTYPEKPLIDSLV